MLDPIVMNFNTCLGRPRNLAEKCTLALVRFDKVNGTDIQNCEDHAWESGPTTDIKPNLRFLRNAANQLRRVEEMTPPNITKRRLANQPDPDIPFDKQVMIYMEALECFT